MSNHTVQLMQILWVQSPCMVASKSRRGRSAQERGLRIQCWVSIHVEPTKVMNSRQKSKLILSWVTLRNTGHRQGLGVDVWCWIGCSCLSLTLNGGTVAFSHFYPNCDLTWALLRFSGCHSQQFRAIWKWSTLHGHHWGPGTYSWALAILDMME